MRKCKSEKRLALPFFAIIAVLTGGFISASAYAQVDYALMVQQTPVEGGSVTPDVGVYNVSANGDIKVTATPKPGYQFVYWLGDVSDPTANSTVVAVNSPKIVVAVFQRSEYELPFESPAASESGGGGGGMVRNNDGQVLPFESAPGGQKYSGYSYPKYQPRLAIPAIPEPSPQDDFPVPGGDEVPEPATMLLLGIGSLLALSRKK